MFDLIFKTEQHTDLSMKLFLTISGNNTTSHPLTLIQLGITLSILLLLMMNLQELSLNYLITKPVVLQALVMKCLNILALYVLLPLLLFSTVAFLKIEFPSNGNTVAFILFLNEIPLMVTLILLDPLVLLNISASSIPKFLPIDLALYFQLILFSHPLIMLPFLTIVPQSLFIF
jgi:hypothetical protein